MYFLPSKPASNTFLALVKYQPIWNIRWRHDTGRKNPWIRDDSGLSPVINYASSSRFKRTDAKFFQISTHKVVIKGRKCITWAAYSPCVLHLQRGFRKRRFKSRWGHEINLKLYVWPPWTLKDTRIRPTTIQFANIVHDTLMSGSYVGGAVSPRKSSTPLGSWFIPIYVQWAALATVWTADFVRRKIGEWSGITSNCLR